MELIQFAAGLARVQRDRPVGQGGVMPLSIGTVSIFLHESEQGDGVLVTVNEIADPAGAYAVVRLGDLDIYLPGTDDENLAAVRQLRDALGEADVQLTNLIAQRAAEEA